METVNIEKLSPTTIVHRESIKYLISGILTGVINTIIFNPYDKAMYNMIKNKNNLFSKINWTDPYAGIKQAVLIRIISYGMYYPFMDFYKILIKNNNPVLIGAFIGAINALLINPINVVKYSIWNNNNTIRVMIQKYGIRILFRSIMYTIFRDTIFSIVHTLLTNVFNPNRDFVKDVLSVSIATVASSPMNYFRNQVLIEPLDKPVPNVFKIWNRLLEDGKTDSNKIIYILNNKLCIGWATLRVALAMAFSRKCYEYVKKIID